MNILWVSDSPLATSAYGQQTALFTQRLARAGHKVTCFGFGFYSGAPLRLPNGLLVLPCIDEARGGDVIASHAELVKADVVFTLADPHTLDEGAFGHLNVPWVAWAPIDTDPPMETTVTALRGATAVWSPSRAGQAALARAGIESTYVPHGIDTRIFRPQDRAAAKKILGLEGKFVVLSVAANTASPSRKGFYETFLAFKRFDRLDAVLYMHTEATGMGRGEDLNGIMRLVGVDPSKVIFPSAYHLLSGLLTPQDLSVVYNAADVFLSTSHGEGFGVPLVEAQACGCPIIAPANTAQTELGGTIPCEAYLPCNGASLRFRPNVDAVVKVLKDGGPCSRRDVSEFDVDRVFERYFLPALALTWP